MGMTAPPLTGTNWGTAVVFATLKWTSRIPPTLAPGNYLIRHELLALHQADTPQWYPECAQLVVTGSGTATPSGSYLTPIPAYASATDPGVMVRTSNHYIIADLIAHDFDRLIFTARPLPHILAQAQLFGVGERRN